MAMIIVTDRDGEEHEIEGEVGLSLMENLRDSNVGDIAAICGGCCSCATCHVYVDEEWLDRLDPPEGDETELVSESENYRDSSRLSCQIEFENSLDGIRVTVAPEE